ncbi:MAG: cysteine desulfurase family protein [Capsulimonas sp.]|uniref:cysteine desulfurase family protein n=1 Tax=Capsulimonas sp. TaxID=2494211 RepID=UPI003262D59B
MLKRPIYMDNNATTRVDPRVLGAMLPYFSEQYGNAASNSHTFGWTAGEAVDKARIQVAALIGADPSEIIFTSGATEADNLALKGVAEAYAEKGDHIITTAIEHKAVLDTAKHLEKLGKSVTYLPVDEYGMIDIEQLKASITERTILVSIMYGNNEIGTLDAIDEIAEICHERGVIFHTDATQAIGKVPIDVKKQKIDLMSLTAHKMYGPKGIGALYVRRKEPRVRLALQMDGGGHERGMRSGTLNVPGIVGFGEACQVCSQEMERDRSHTQGLRDYLWEQIQATVPDVKLNGHPTRRLSNNLSIAIRGVDADALLASLSGVALSTGSACTSASVAPSHVLLALPDAAQIIGASIRLGVSRFTTKSEVDQVLSLIGPVVARLRGVTAVAP